MTSFLVLYVFVFLSVLLLGPFLVYFFILFAAKVIELYARYLDWASEKLGIES